MKLIHVILGCVLAAGLTARAADGTVISNIVFTPLNLALKLQYNNNGHVKRETVTSKDLLKLMGYPDKNRLVTDYDGFGAAADVYVIENNSVLEDLTTDGVLSVNFEKLVNQRQLLNGKTGAYVNEESGVITLNFNYTNGIAPAVVAKNTQPSIAEAYIFEASGVYTWHEDGNAIKNGEQKTRTKLKATGMVGVGSDTSVAPTVVPNIKPDSKNETIGDFLIKDGTVKGTGSGSVTTGG